MRWMIRTLGALLLVVLLVHPAGALVITTHFGYPDAPQFATSAPFIDVFFTHENGKVYRLNTGPAGIALIDVPPGTIKYCQAYDQADLVASWPCSIPVGEKAMRKAFGISKGESERAPVAPFPGSRGLLAYNLNMLQGGQNYLCDGCTQGWYPPRRPRIILAFVPPPPAVTITTFAPGTKKWVLNPETHEWELYGGGDLLPRSLFNNVLFTNLEVFEKYGQADWERWEKAFDAINDAVRRGEISSSEGIRQWGALPKALDLDDFIASLFFPEQAEENASAGDGDGGDGGD